MTKVQTSYKLYRKLEDTDLVRLSKVQSVYGIFAAKVAPSLDALHVEFDASRLSLVEMQVILETHGLPIVVEQQLA